MNDNLSGEELQYLRANGAPTSKRLIAYIDVLTTELIRAEQERHTDLLKDDDALIVAFAKLTKAGDSPLVVHFKNVYTLSQGGYYGSGDTLGEAAQNLWGQMMMRRNANGQPCLLLHSGARGWWIAWDGNDWVPSTTGFPYAGNIEFNIHRSKPRIPKE